MRFGDHGKRQVLAAFDPEKSRRPRPKFIISSDNIELRWNTGCVKNYSVFFAVSASQMRAPLASAQTSPLLRT
jgi:hypothetical protein